MDKLILSIDIETYSSVDLRKSGVYRYTESPDFKVLMIAFAYGGADVQIVDDAPFDLINALANPAIIKSAFNANFERVCLSKWLGIKLPADQWRCTMVHALELGLPASLDEVAKALGVDQQKDSAGKKLIKKFCMPNKDGKQNLPSDELVDTDWQAFKEYCIQDVRTEMAIRKKLEQFPLHDDEWALWAIDQEINDRGIEIDSVLVANAVNMNDIYTDKLEAEAIQLTGLSNPNSLQQLKSWFKLAEDIEIDDFKKQTMPDLLKQVESDTARRMLEIRQEMSKTSVKKYHAMWAGKCSDNRVRGLLQFYGAGRTGRWAGRLVQVQNLPGNKLVDLDTARQFVRTGNYEAVEMLYGNVPDVLSQLIRTAFVPRPGHRFIVADFSAIEARVIAWLAGEQWRLDVFNTHGKIYEASAAQMFNVLIETIGKGSPLRQKGKVAELALGYQGGVNALIAMGALKMGLTEEELPDIVKAWRSANPAIVALWHDMEHSFKFAIENKHPVILGCLNFKVEKNVGFIELPSGRRLAYVKPKLEPHPKFEGKEHITYDGVNQITRKWTRLSTYGGKLVENCLAGDTLVLTNRGWSPITQIKNTDLLWDGIEWVSHDGLIEKGTQPTIDINGVRMTEDHKILTDSGWKNASSCEGHNGYQVTLPDGYPVFRLRRSEINLERSMRLREDGNYACKRISERETEVVRLHALCSDRSEKDIAWHVETSGVCSVEVNDCTLSEPSPSGLEKLRRSRNFGLSEMVREFRELLVRLGTDISKRIGHRPNRREWELHTEQLPLDNTENQFAQQKEIAQRSDTLGSYERVGGFGENGNQLHDIVVSFGSCEPVRFVRTSGRKEQVFDILNSGPRNRFTVLSKDGPFIVHNCVQAIARDCLAESLVRLEKAGYRTVMHVHDEVVLEVERGVGSAEHVAKIMGEGIEWAPGLPLTADAFETDYYRKD